MRNLSRRAARGLTAVSISESLLLSFTEIGITSEKDVRCLLADVAHHTRGSAGRFARD